MNLELVFRDIGNNRMLAVGVLKINGKLQDISSFSFIGKMLDNGKILLTILKKSSLVKDEHQKELWSSIPLTHLIQMNAWDDVDKDNIVGDFGGAAVIKNSIKFENEIESSRGCVISCFRFDKEIEMVRDHLFFRTSNFSENDDVWEFELEIDVKETNSHFFNGKRPEDILSLMIWSRGDSRFRVHHTLTEEQVKCAIEIMELLANGGEFTKSLKEKCASIMIPSFQFEDEEYLKFLIGLKAEGIDFNKHFAFLKTSDVESEWFKAIGNVGKRIYGDK